MGIYGIPIPPRDDVRRTVDSRLNNGNYGVQLDNGLRQHFDDVVRLYQGTSVLIDFVDHGHAYHNFPVGLMDAPVRISSAFRCPQHNKALLPCGAASVTPNSRHQFGQALDLVPNEAPGLPKGIWKRFALPDGRMTRQFITFPTLLPALQAAGDALPDVDDSECEIGNNPNTSCTDKRANHVHIQWVLP